MTDEIVGPEPKETKISFKDRRDRIWGDYRRERAAHETMLQGLPQTFWEAFQLQTEEYSRKLGIESLRMLFLINGGALVALLAFMGSTAGKAGTPSINVVEAIRPFGFGLVAIAAAALCSTLATQALSGHFLAAWQKSRQTTSEVLGMTLQSISGLAMATSLGCAIWGFDAAVGLYGEAKKVGKAEVIATEADVALLRAELAEAKLKLELATAKLAAGDARTAQPAPPPKP